MLKILKHALEILLVAAFISLNHFAEALVVNLWFLIESDVVQAIFHRFKLQLQLLQLIGNIGTGGAGVQRRRE